MTPGYISLWIPGRPIPAPRPRVRARGGAYYPPGYDAWLEAAAWEVQRQRHGHRLAEPVQITACVHPDGYLVTTRQTSSRRPRGLRGDLDNYAKALLDALTYGGLWDDDRQAVALTIRFYPDPREDR